jgi:protein-tyrosine phosphatase
VIDIHHHLIFGVDDGPPHLEAALAMAKAAAAEGVTRIVCTPHASDEYPYKEQLINERFAELSDALADEIQLSLGCELHLTAENIFEARENPLRFSFDKRGYLLVEFGNQSIPSQMLNALSALQDAGYTIIIAHPERYPGVVRRPELVGMWMRGGCLMQVTAGSLYGRFGRSAEALANQMLERNWVHFIATDAHDVKWRPPHLKKSYDYIANRVGEETARRLCVTNPLAAVCGTKLPEQPMPEGLADRIPLSPRGTDHAAHNGSVVADSRGERPRHKRKKLFERLFHGVQY